MKSVGLMAEGAHDGALRLELGLRRQPRGAVRLVDSVALAERRRAAEQEEVARRARATRVLIGSQPSITAARP